MSTENPTIAHEMSLTEMHTLESEDRRVVARCPRALRNGTASRCGRPALRLQDGPPFRGPLFGHSIAAA